MLTQKTNSECAPLGALPTKPETLMAFADPDTHSELYTSVQSKRLVAFIVDSAAIIALSLLAVVMTAFIGAFFLPLLIALIGFAYRTVFIARNSATPGMALMAIEFRDLRGRKLDRTTALLHTLGFMICWALFPLQIVSMVLMLISHRGQGLPDHFLGTVAINRLQNS